MNTTVSPTLTSLTKARALDLPSREAMLARAHSVSRFWSENAELLEVAWQEWDTQHNALHHLLTDDLIAPQLRVAVAAAWENPASEDVVKALWEEVSPGVYKAQFFDPQKLTELRNYLASAADAGIPSRPPYGIALNRFGAMLDKRSEGYLAAPAFQAFYQRLMDVYMRPIARLLFPEIMGFDQQTFGFSIQYQPGVDTSLQPHTDASSATMNINMNLPEETFTGSQVDFYDPSSGKTNSVTFEPGIAMLHRGNVPHAAHPITSGSRSNIVLWLYGNRMQTPALHLQGESVAAEARWQVPDVVQDEFAPF